jgi:inner membrane protein
VDSVTQIVLGAGVGELCLGKKLGNRAQLMGAIAGTLPDLDIVLNPLMKSATDVLLLHRSYSHAWPVHIVAALPFAYISYLILRKQVTLWQLYVLWFLGLSTHALLDCFTTYGTQLWLPFTRHLVGFNNINIIDPLYTLPFMVLLIICLCLKRSNNLRHNLAKWAMGISTGYMTLTLVSKYAAHQAFTQQLQAQHINYNSLSTSPSILNNALWAGIATSDTAIDIAEYSHLQGDKNISFVHYPKNTHLLKQVTNTKAVNTLLWFAQGKYCITQSHADSIQFYVTKWGRSNWSVTKHKDAFIFYYLLYREPKGSWLMKPIEPSSDDIKPKEILPQLWQRIWHK